MATGEEIQTAERQEYLVEEAPIVAMHDAATATDRDLQAYREILNAGLDAIDQLVRSTPYNNRDELVALRLATRCFNSAAASLRLVRCGYFQPSLTMIRDISECTNLLELFRCKPEALSEWHGLPEKERKQNYSPRNVRMELEQRGRADILDIHQNYDMLSKYGAHPTPEGFVLISPDGMTSVGPFPDANLLRAVYEELMAQLIRAVDAIGFNASNETPSVVLAKIAYLARMLPWRREFKMPSSTFWGTIVGDRSF